jgi:hypothetical protein
MNEEHVKGAADHVAGKTSNQSLVFEPLLMPVGWIAIRTQTVAKCAQSMDHPKALRTIPLQRYIPLH